MGTQKPLKDLMPDILAPYEKHVEYLEANRRLYEIFKGQIREEIEKSLRKEIISHAAFARICERIPPINILRKSVDKLSKVYIENPIRLADNESDQEVMGAISKASDLNNHMMVANSYYNLHNMFAIEPFVDSGKQMVRVLGGHQFLPFSDDPSNPMKMTVFIKLLGNETQRIAQEYDEQGRKISEEDQVRRVTILALYSDDEFLIVDTGGAIRRDKMREMGITIADDSFTSVNGFGRIPAFYGNKSKSELVPFPNQEGLSMSILIPKLFADLNYSAQFMSHSIIWTKNTDISGQEINPDAVVNLGERTEENGDPEMGVITPSVDIPNVLMMISNQIDLYFSSIGIKTQTAGNMKAGEEASGVSKAIDEGDTTAERKVQVEFFRSVETNMWDLIADMQSVWTKAGILNGERRTFSTTFKDTLRIMFAEMKPLKTFQQKITEIQLMRDQKLITRRQAIKQLHPDFTDKQIDAWISELDNEAKESFEQMMSFGGPTMQAERDQDGTFNEGNQAAAEQSPENNLQSREDK